MNNPSGDSDEYLQSLIDENPKPIFQADFKGTLLFANDSSKSILQEWDCKVAAFIREMIEDIKDAPQNSCLEVNVGDIYHSFLICKASRGNILNFFGNKITELVDQRNQFMRKQDEFQALSDASHALLKNDVFEKKARQIFNLCKKMTGATAGYVALLSEDGLENEVLFLDAGGLSCTVDPELPMPIRGLRGEAYETGQIIFANNFAASQWMDFMPGGHVKLENVLFAPLRVEGRVKGIIGLANKLGGFNDDDVKILNPLSDITAVALINSMNLEALQRSRNDYKEAFNQTEFFKDLLSHDMNNILQAILLSVDLLNTVAKKIEKNSKIDKIVKNTRYQVLRGSNLIENVQKIVNIKDQKNLLEPTMVIPVSVQKLKNLDNHAHLNNTALQKP